MIKHSSVLALATAEFIEKFKIQTETRTVETVLLYNILMW